MQAKPWTGRAEFFTIRLIVNPQFVKSMEHKKRKRQKKTKSKKNLDNLCHNVIEKTDTLLPWLQNSLPYGNDSHSEQGFYEEGWASCSP